MAMTRHQAMTFERRCQAKVDTWRRSWRRINVTCPGEIPTIPPAVDLLVSTRALREYQHYVCMAAPPVYPLPGPIRAVFGTRLIATDDIADDEIRLVIA